MCRTNNISLTCYLPSKALDGASDLVNFTKIKLKAFRALLLSQKRYLKTTTPSK